jgi:hypothetical protein
MASARLKPRPPIGHARKSTKRRARAVHRSIGSHQRTDRAERGGALSVFGTALLVLAAVSLALVTGFMA